jgi:hypothetical protein
MIDSEDQALRLHVGDQLADVAPQPLDLAVLLFVQPPHADMDALAGLGEIRFHLFTDEEILQVGVLVQQVERTVDRVVIGQGDVRHPPFFRDAIDVLGRVVAVSGIRATKVLEDRKTAVTVQVCTLQTGVREALRRHRFNHRRFVQPSGIFYNSRARTDERLSVAHHQRTNGTTTSR